MKMKPKNITVRLKRNSLRAFQELKKVANKEETITYGELGEKIKAHPYFVLPRALGIIWDWCEKNGYPHINALVVGKYTDIPSEGYQPKDRPSSMKKWRKLWREIHQFDWDDIHIDIKRDLKLGTKS